MEEECKIEMRLWQKMIQTQAEDSKSNFELQRRNECSFKK